MAKPTPEQLAKINMMAKVPLTADEVYVHKFRLIGTEFIPSRFLKFDLSALEKYLQDAQNGDTVQIFDHTFGNSWVEKVTVQFGRFFDAEFVQENGETHLDAWWYMKAGTPTYVPEYNTDVIDQQINSGILHDSSVGVSWGFSQCSICGNDIRDYENCKHWPGKYYDLDGGARRELCYVIAKAAPSPRVDNSHMPENSLVCAGAYPSAGALSESNRQTSGKDAPIRLNNIADLKLVNKDAPVFCCLSSTSATFQITSENLRDASELHQLYHSMYSETELPEGWTMAKLTQKHKEAVKELLDAGHEHLMADALDGTLNEALKAKSTKGSEVQMSMTDEEKKLYDNALSENAQFKADLKAAEVDSVAALTTKIEELSSKVEELTPQAELGKKYREDVIGAALKSGVRDQGNDFKEDAYKKMFASLSIDEIKEMGEAWEASALAKLGIPQGHTKGEELNLPGSELKQAVDPELYKVGR